MIQNRFKNLDQGAIDLAQCLTEAQLGRTALRNAVFQKSGIAMSGSSIQYLQKVLSDDDVGSTAATKDSVNELIKVLGSQKKVKFILLFHDTPQNASKPLCYPYPPKNGKMTAELREEGMDTQVSECMEDAPQALAETELFRLEHKLGCKARLLLAVAWTTAYSSEMFSKFPEW
jgi:hypothetical protein